jgi:hypothetical protein
MRKLSIALAVMFVVGASGMAFAQASKCDSTITKAAGKKVACKDGVYSKAQKSGGVPDAAKLQKCQDKFTKACGKGQAAGDCVVQTGTCAQIEATADACALDLSTSTSPSGAFLE